MQQQRIEDVADWLMGKLNTPLTIRKEEDGDIDQVMMTVEKVSILPGDPHRDDYVEEDRLVLQGDGTIANAPLPRQSYEIPLRRGFGSHMRQDELELVTERAVYRLFRSKGEEALPNGGGLVNFVDWQSTKIVTTSAVFAVSGPLVNIVDYTVNYM